MHTFSDLKLNPGTADHYFRKDAPKEYPFRICWTPYNLVLYDEGELKIQPDPNRWLDKDGFLLDDVSQSLFTGFKNFLGSIEKRSFLA